MYERAFRGRRLRAASLAGPSRLRSDIIKERGCDKGRRRCVKGEQFLVIYGYPPARRVTHKDIDRIVSDVRSLARVKSSPISSSTDISPGWPFLQTDARKLQGPSNIHTRARQIHTASSHADVNHDRCSTRKGDYRKFADVFFQSLISRHVDSRRLTPRSPVRLCAMAAGGTTCGYV